MNVIISCSLCTLLHCGLFFPAVVTCPALSDPTNGMVDVPSNNFGSIATYTCNRGHNLTGDATRTCEATGMWSGSVACNRKFKQPHNLLFLRTVLSFSY